MPRGKSVVTIGMFDGVHVGHQRLIRETIRWAVRLHARSVALTFDPDPQSILAPEHVQPHLMPLAVRLKLLKALGVDRVHVIRFTRRFSQLPAAAFIKRILVKQLAAAGVVVGEHFTFGQGRRGGLALLQEVGQRYGMRIVVVPPVRRAGDVVSSSRIRLLVSQGHLSRANRLLGRPMRLSGTVVRGDGRARRLGFPTANVRLEPGLCLPPLGVYRVECLYGARRFSGLMNLGVRPTFSSTSNGHLPVVCEVHLPAFHGALYGRLVRIDVLKRLRAERRFPHAQALTEQIRRDLRRAFGPSFRSV